MVGLTELEVCISFLSSLATCICVFASQIALSTLTFFIYKFSSSYGQSLETSIYIGETLFAILIAIMGLVLFAHLIGNMQVRSNSIFILHYSRFDPLESDLENILDHSCCII